MDQHSTEGAFENFLGGIIAGTPKGKVPAAEVLLRKEEAILPGLKGIRELRLTDEFQGVAFFAGSILDGEEAELAINHGASVIISGAFSPKIEAACIKNDVPYLAPASTLQEVKNLHERGYKTIKLFPAIMTGDADEDMKAMMAPLARLEAKGLKIDPNSSITCTTPTEVLKEFDAGERCINFVPPTNRNVEEIYTFMKEHGMTAVCTGGVNDNNLADFARNPVVSGVGASAIGKADNIEEATTAAHKTWAENNSRLAL